MPPQPVQRYATNERDSPIAIWRFNHKVRAIPTGKTLRLEVLAPAIVRWSDDNWRTVHDTATRDIHLGVHLADLPSGTLSDDAAVLFTFYWTAARRWEGVDFAVRISADALS